MARSFSLRLALSFAAVAVAAAVLTAVLVNLAFDRRFDAYVSEQRQQGQEQLVAALESSYRRADGWQPDDLASVGAAALMNGLAFSVEDVTGRTIWSSLDEATTSMAMMHRDMMGLGQLGPERRLPIDVGGQRVGLAVVRLPDGGLRPQDLSLRASINSLLATGAVVAGFVALAVGLILARRATAPVAELTATARQLADGDRSSRITSNRKDELGEMGRAFNQMAGVIEEEDRLRRAFAADVAHELRTPLTVLRTQVEALQDGVLSPTPGTLSSLQDEVLRLSRLVADLEAMASADAATFSLQFEMVALRPLLESVAREMSGVFADREVRLELGLDVDVQLEADEARLRQVVSNLLSNAAKFTPTGGLVRLELEQDGRWAMIRVRDTGPGIPADERDLVFDRFFRGRDVRAGGSGIGLAVVRRLVTAHGGEVQVDADTGHGSTFTVRLPRDHNLPSPILHRTFMTAP